MVRVAASGGAIALALGAFVAATHVMRAEQEATADIAVLRAMEGLRTPSLTAVMLGVTAFGSSTPLAAFILISFACLLALRDRWGLLHLVVASLGIWILEAVTKHLFARSRPTAVTHLVHVSGYSYPSGHSLASAVLYLTIAVVAGRHLRARAAKTIPIVAAFVLIAAVGVSRVYLGVHYPSDVAGGIALGTAWALILTATFGAIAARRRV
jgi:undecaprenyl-diphosphatase